MDGNQKITNIISVDPNRESSKANAEQEYQNQINLGVVALFFVVFATAGLDLYTNREKYKNQDIKNLNNDLSNYSHQLNLRFKNLAENVFEFTGVEVIERDFTISNTEYKLIKARSKPNKDTSKASDYYLIAIPKTFFRKFNTTQTNNLKLTLIDVANMRKAVNILSSGLESEAFFIDNSENERFLIGLYKNSDKSKRKLLYIFPEIDDNQSANTKSSTSNIVNEGLRQLPEAIFIEAGSETCI